MKQWIVVLVMLLGCFQIASAKNGDSVMRGVASWYGLDLQGTKTATGGRYNQYDYTAAHKTLPFGTLVRVTNLRNKRDVVVKINDRGPYIKGRIIDLSLVAAKKIDLISSGVAPVEVRVMN